MVSSIGRCALRRLTVLAVLSRGALARLPYRPHATAATVPGGHVRVSREIGSSVAS